jgi:hypothetical protein
MPGLSNGWQPFTFLHEYPTGSTGILCRHDLIALKARLQHLARAMMEAVIHRSISSFSSMPSRAEYR